MPEETLVATTQGWQCSRCGARVPQAGAHACQLPAAATEPSLTLALAA